MDLARLFQTFGNASRYNSIPRPFEGINLNRVKGIELPPYPFPVIHQSVKKKRKLFPGPTFLR